MLAREILIDDEFENALRRQTDEESQSMRASIDEFGFLNPMIVWKGHGILVDGHHRLREYKRRLDEHAAIPRPGMLERLSKAMPKPPEPPDFVQIDFKDRAAVLEFILSTQQGRRNMTAGELSLKRAEFYQREKTRLGSEGDAAKATAKEHGVSVATVRRDEVFAEAVKTLTPIVSAAMPNVDVVKVVTERDAPPRARIIQAAIIANVDPIAAVEMATTPASKLRLDAAEDGKPKPPAWEKPLASFEAVLEKIWADDNPEQRRAVKDRLNQTIVKFFPATKPKQTVMGQVVKETQPC